MPSGATVDEGLAVPTGQPVLAKSNFVRVGGH